MNIGTVDSAAVLGTAVTAVSQGLAKPINSYNRFLDRVGDALSPSRSLLGKPYAKQNPFEKRLSRPDPVLSYDWIGVVLSANLSSTVQLPWYYIDGLTIPDLSLAPNEQPWNGVTRKTSGKASVGSAELKLYTGVDGVTSAYVEHWLRSVYRHDGYYNLPYLYKRDIAAFLLDAKRKIVVDFRLVGCWPTQVSSVTLSAESSIVETSVTLSVDECFVNYDSDFSAIKDSVDSLVGTVSRGVTNSVISTVSNLFG